MGKTYTIINNGIEQKQIKNEFLEEYLSQGWSIGRLHEPWNKGLTIEDERVLKNIKHSKRTWSNKSDNEIEEWKEKLRQANSGKKWTQDAIAKRSETRKKNGFIPSKEQREKTSEKLKGHLVSQETRDKISKANMGHPGIPCSDEKRKYLSILHSSEEYQARQNKIKKQNGTLNTSKPEQRVREMLIYAFGDDIEYSYRDERYPYNCDFYIKSLDLFIELNFMWTHGGEPFNENNNNHIEKLKIWKEKSEHSDFYKNAIYTWTNLDVKKRETAIKNKLNYLMFYKEKDFLKWFNTQLTKQND